MAGKTKEKALNPNEDCSTPTDRETKIAEYAYYKAESRGFEPGHELEDWYEAEREFSL